MTDFRSVTPDFAVAPQLGPADMAAAAAAGFKAVVCNRPDGEALGQPSASVMQAAAEQAGLVFEALPFAGPPPMEAVDGLARVQSATSGPVLAYCRSGTRSVTAWAMSQAKARTRSVEDIVQSAANAGYDLSGARPVLERLAAQG